MGEQHTNRGLALGVVVCVLATLGFVITLMPRRDPEQWGEAVAVGLFGPIGGITLVILGGIAWRRATRKPAKIVAGAGIVLSVASIISALTLWTT